MNDNNRIGPKKVTAFRRSRQKQPTADLLKKTLKNWPTKIGGPNEKISLPDIDT